MKPASTAPGREPMPPTTTIGDGGAKEAAQKVRVADREHHLGKGQRQDRKVDPGAPQRDEADHQGKDARNHDRQRQTPDDVVIQQLVHPDHGIGTDPEKGRMAKAEIAGQAEQDVEPDGEDAEDHKALH